ncbi:unnamed protein product [Orchesella dallaii]|uniref:C2H2-type domain-containing protein n=1 Tax=Orchesella dallaii TaxID=48710 RepID=A0ABP1QXR4_9HEXA
MPKRFPEVFKCRICLKPYKSKRGLSRHQGSHNASRPRDYSCITCKKTFFRSDILYSHVKNVHQKINTCWCVFCEKQFCNKRSLDLHIRSHTGEKHFWCDMCDNEFKTKAALEIHRKQHTEGKTYKKYRCETCSRSFDVKSNYTRHLQIHNPVRPRPYLCAICDKQFTSYHDLERHSRLVHEKIKKYPVCVFCEEQFGTVYDLNQHIIKHIGEKHFFCDICDKEFTKATALRNHKKLHTKQNLFKCTKCSKAYTELKSLKVHRLNHEPKSFQCVFCEKLFARNINLEAHILMHVNEKPFFCSECDEEFKLQKALALHLKTGQCSKKKVISSEPFSSKANTSQTEQSDGQDEEDVMDEDLELQEETENHLEVIIPNVCLPGEEESGTLPLDRAPEAVPEANSVRENNERPEVRVCGVCGEQFSGEKLDKDYSMHILAKKHYVWKF